MSYRPNDDPLFALTVMRCVRRVNIGIEDISEFGSHREVVVAILAKVQARVDGVRNLTNSLDVYESVLMETM